MIHEGTTSDDFNEEGSSRRKKRKGKNRPQETSSKLPVKFYKNTEVKQIRHRDPRFDSLCGTFDHKEFSKAYKFINEIKQKEKHALKKALKDKRQIQNQDKIKEVLQRMNNQELERKRLEKKEAAKKQLYSNQILLLEKGKKPHFPKKSEIKLTNILDSFEELKSTNRLQSHIKKKMKKISRKPAVGPSKSEFNQLM